MGRSQQLISLRTQSQFLFLLLFILLFLFDIHSRYSCLVFSISQELVDVFLSFIDIMDMSFIYIYAACNIYYCLVGSSLVRDRGQQSCVRSHTKLNSLECI